MDDRDRNEAGARGGPGDEEPSQEAGNGGAAEETKAGGAPQEEAPPPYTMKAIGTRAQRLDRAMSDGMSQAVVKMGDKAGGRVRRGMQSGQWQNYVFLIVVALIVIIVVAVLFRR